MLYGDPIIGIVDKHFENLPMQEYFKDVTARLKASKPTNPLFSTAYELIIRFSSVLEHKADFGVRLKRAYDVGDREALTEFVKECDVILERLYALRDYHYNVWMTFNKPFCWETHDIRYGGLICRFNTVKRRLADYIAGRVECLEELEEERLFLAGDESDPIPTDYFLWNRYKSFVTANEL